MIVDGITDAHRGTWSKLTRLHTATVVLPMHTTLIDSADTRPEAPGV